MSRMSYGAFQSGDEPALDESVTPLLNPVTFLARLNRLRVLVQSVRFSKKKPGKTSALALLVIQA
jgi:hypothetical protein